MVGNESNCRLLYGIWRALLIFVLELELERFVVDYSQTIITKQSINIHVIELAMLLNVSFNAKCQSNFTHNSGGSLSKNDCLA